MKKRILSLALILSLLLSTLIPGSLAFAEEPAQPAAEEAIETEFVEEEPAGDPAPAEEEPSIEEEVPPEEEAPAEGEPAEEEVPPQEEAPAEGEPSVDEEPSVEEEPAEGEPSAEEEPAAEAPEDGEFIEMEEIDLASIPALGSSGDQYAGVHYISRAAFNRMSEAAQRVYVWMVDGFDGLMERGIAVSNAVFSLQEDGRVGLTMTFPTKVFAEYMPDPDEALAGEAAESEPAPEPVEEAAAPESEPEQAEVPAEPAEDPAAPTGDAFEPAEEVADPAEEAAESETMTIIAENVELAESLRPKREKISSANTEPLDIVNKYDLPEIRQLNTLFWKNKDLFYNQLDADQKRIFSAAKRDIIDDGYDSFQYNLGYDLDPYDPYIDDKLDEIIIDVFATLSALIDTYPYNFDYVNWGDDESFIFDIDYDVDENLFIESGFSKSNFYSGSLETKAQKKVADLVTKAYNSAIKDYPNNVSYGIVRFFDDWICKNNYYHEVGTLEYSWLKEKYKSVYYFCHCSYGILLKGYGVCESYALAMTRLLDAAGIPNLYVMGDVPGGGHAWNYVQMHDGKFYLQDSTWNDPVNKSQPSTREYLLAANDRDHYATGQRFVRPETPFSFATISSTRYSPALPENASIQLDESSLNLMKGDSATLSIVEGSYYEHYSKFTWTTSNKKVATVKDGKVTGVGPGTAVISLCLNKNEPVASCEVYVSQVSGLTFDGTKKAKITSRVGVERPETIVLNVNMGNSGNTAEDLVDMDYLEPVDVRCSDVTKVDVAPSLDGNQIRLNVYPWQTGRCTVTIKFANKTATLTLDVAQPLSDSWFDLDFSKVKTRTYDGKAKKPDVVLTRSAPSDLKVKRDYTVKYLNNTNAGTATVRIEGKGNYGSTIDKTFTINHIDIEGATVTTGKNREKVYDGKVFKQSITVKLNGKTLKKDKDYEVLYAYLDENEELAYATELLDAHMYLLLILGKGNYEGLVDPTKDDSMLYNIRPVPLADLKLTAKKSVKYNGKPVSAASLKFTVKSGSVALKEGRDYWVAFSTARDHKTQIAAPSARGEYMIWAVPKTDNIDHGGQMKGLSFTIK